MVSLRKIVASVLAIAGLLLIITDPFGVGTPTQYSVNLISLLVFIPAGISIWIKSEEPDNIVER